MSVCLSLLPGIASAQEEAEVDDVIISQPDPPPTPEASSDAPLVPPGGVPVVGMPVQAPEPRAQPPEVQPPPPPAIPRYSVELQTRVAFPAESSFDQAMTAFGYSGVRVESIGYIGVAIPTLEWLWLGARYGMRGRNWTHPDQESAVVAAGDLLLTAQVRFLVGRVVELGVLFGGGAAAMVVQMNGVSSDQVVGRFQLEATLAFRIGPNFAIGPRIGWSYFQWDGMNRYDHGLDIGGPFIGIGLEGRE